MIISSQQVDAVPVDTINLHGSDNPAFDSCQRYVSVLFILFGGKTVIDSDNKKSSIISVVPAFQSLDFFNLTFGGRLSTDAAA